MAGKSLIFVLSIFVSVLFFKEISGLEAGDSCYTRIGQQGTCKLVYECAEAIRDLKKGVPLDLCNRRGSVNVVCCGNPRRVQTQQPVQSPQFDTSRLRLADQKCHEYSEYVYENVEVPNFLISQQTINRRVDKCGFKATQLVVGGTDAAAKEFPHMSLLGYGSAGNIQWNCGGSIISRRFVLTAAHCVTTEYGNPTFVLIGDLNYARNDDDADPRTYSVARAFSHPEYRKGANYHDIALVEVAQNMQFGQYARPACLNADFNAPERRAIVTGWGFTEFFGGVGSSSLLKVTLDIFRFNECTPKFPPDSMIKNGLNERQHLCAGSYNEMKDACEGDSGGPLQVYHSIYCMYKILGVTSFGKGCATVVGIPGVYTRVANYIDWIESNAFRHG